MKQSFVTKGFVSSLFPKKPTWSHKGDSGTVLIIGGSKTYSGSAALAALAALRTGSDLAVVAAPERAANIIASFSPDIITVPLKGDYLNKSHTKQLIELSSHHDAVVLGGGIEVNKQTEGFVKTFISELSRPCVVDADALKVLRKSEDLLYEKKHILTPHQREFSILFGTDPTEKLEERIKTTGYFSRKLKTTILLKGHIDIISSQDKTMLNRTGNQYMTKGGTGDVLAGICGSLLASGIKQFDSACAAAFINGSAGDLAAKRSGRGLLSAEIIENISSIVG